MRYSQRALVLSFCFLVSSFLQAQTINNLSPSSGEPSSSFTINGSGFGSNQGTVKLNGQTCGINSWSAGSISANVPNGASSGNVVLTISGGAQSNGVAFTVLTPVISSLSPSSGSPGALVTISGNYFGSAQGQYGTVTFSGQSSSVNSWSDSTVKVYVPAGASTGNVVVKTNGLETSSGVNFTVAPIINSLTPPNGEPGNSITIAGLNFTSTTGSVTFNGQSATVTSWSNTSIVAVAPSGVTSGNVVVIAGTLSSAGVWFGVLRPAIAGVSPVAGISGTSVTISGNHFGSSAGSVTFNGQSGSISSWSDSSIVAAVPASATTGNVVVSNGGLQSNGVNFIVGPFINSLSPGSGNAGASVTASGFNFGTIFGGVTFNSTPTTASTWANTSLAAPVPNAATSGPVVVTPEGGAASPGVMFVVPTVNSAWDQADIGSVNAAGSTSVNSGAYTVSSYSGSLGGTADSLHYVFEPVSGDFDMIMRATIQTDSSSSMQYGITVRDSLAAGGLSLSCVGQWGGYAAVSWRTSVNGSGTQQTLTVNPSSPIWLRVKRYGNTFVCLSSSNGTSWARLGSLEVVAINPNAVVGMSVMSANRTLGQVTFDNISLTLSSGPLPSGWLQQDLGTNNGPGDATYSNNAFTVSSLSNGLGLLSSDNAHYIYQPANGDVDVIAHITWNPLFVDNAAEAGIMLRQSLAPDDLQVSCLITQGSLGGTIDGRSLAATTNTGGSYYSLSNTNVTWLKLSRRGSLFDCYGSTDGTNWTLGNEMELNLPSAVEVGIVQSSGNGTFSVATFDTVSVNGISPLAGPWQQQDIGSVTAPGDATLSSSVFTVESNSYDVAGSSDNLHYVYQQAGGNLNLIARVSWQQYATNYPKAGVMVRQSLGASDLQFSCLVERLNYVYAEWRTSSGGTDQTALYYYGSGTYWVKINRTGNTFTCYASSNGTSWTTVQSTTVTMTSDVYVGLAQSSYDGNYSLSTIDNVTLQANLPTVAITYPVNGSTVYLSQPVVLTATTTASPGASVTSVQYFDGTTSLGTATVSPYSLNIGVPSRGSHTYTAEVTDSAGLQAFSVADTAAMSNPQITSVSPDHGKAGTQVRVFGIGFGTSAAGVTVSFNGVPAPITGFGNSEIDAIVPSGSGSGQMGVSWPDGSNADGAPGFGPCPQGQFCVTDFVISPSVVIGDGNHTATGTVTVAPPPGLSSNWSAWGSAVWGPLWSYSYDCVSPAFFAVTGLSDGCTSPTPSFQLTLRAVTVTNTVSTWMHAFEDCWVGGGCADPGAYSYVTVAGNQPAGTPEMASTCPTEAGSSRPEPQPECGEPINLKTGNTYIQESDYSLPGLGGGISITRTWNSQWSSTAPLVQAGMFGDSWRASYEDRIQSTSSGVNYWLADGKVWRFSISNGVYTISSPVDAHATLAYDSTAQQYTLTFVSGAKKIFNSNGYLIQVVDRNGNAAVLTYDNSNRLTQVTSAGNQTLNFVYGAGNQVSSLQDSVGTIASYTYDSGLHLTNVTYADNSQLNYAYDANGLITSVTDALGKVLESHTYDGQRRGLTSQRANGVEAVSISYPHPGFSVTLDSASNSSNYNYGQIGEKTFIGSVSGPGCATCGIRGFNQYTYDANGNVIASFDSNGVPTLYTYDGNGHVTSRSTPLNNHLVTWQYSYNGFGELLTLTDPLGNVTTNNYDANGNLLTSTTPAPDSNTAASATTYGYDSKGELTTITDPLNNTTTLAYYATGLLHTITDAQNNVTTFNYDARGNRTDVYDALNNHTAFAYDGRNRLTTITNPDNSTVIFAYDTRGRRTSVTDGNGKVTQYAYDDADRLTSVTDANNNTTQYAYDLESNLTSITDANNHTTSFNYDTQGNLTKTTFPSTKAETYSYDNVGNLMTKTDRKNQTISYGYDPLNRLASKTYPDSTSVTYTYDDSSRLTQVQDPTGTYSFVFDNMARLKQTRTAYSFLSGNPLTVVYGYDKASNITSMTDPNNSQTTYTYDTLNRLSNITDFNNNSFGFSYDALSRRAQLTRSNGINTNYGYDSVSNLLSVLHQQGASTLDGASYTYDLAGNRKTKTNLLNSATSNFSYDNIYQLTGATGASTESYTYDPVGNRLTSQSVSSYSYNNSNELTAAGSVSYTYDDNGNTRTKTDSTGTTTYNWDFENRLASVQLPNSTTVTFKYDPFGRRVRKSGASTTNYVYDGSDVIEEVDQNANILVRYSQGAGIDDPLSELRAGAISYYEQDGLGSVTSLSSTSSALANSYVYDSFGNLTGSNGTITNTLQYTGRDYDPESGLRYYRARYYDAANGRFLAEDPAGFGAGVNFYSYVGNTPTSWRDPDGLRKVKVCRQPVESYPSEGHTYIMITDDEGKVLIDPVDGLPMTYGILGKKKGSKENQQVKKGDPRNYGKDCKYANKCDEVKIDTLVDALETAWVTQACATCGKHYRGWFPTIHGIDGYNSNTYVFNMLSNAGMTPPHFEHVPGYRKARGLWYPIPMD